MKPLDEIKNRIKARLKELDQEWKDEPCKNSNHLASRIGGEIDGCNWVLEEIEQIETPRRNQKESFTTFFTQ